MGLLRDGLGRVARLAEKLPIVSPLQTGEANGLLALVVGAEVKLDIDQRGATSGADRLVFGLFAFCRSRRNLVGSDVGLEYFRAAKMASRLNASCEGGGATKKS
jgi:hypothetical protein